MKEPKFSVTQNFAASSPKEDTVRKVKVMRRKEGTDLTKTIQTLNSDRANSDEEVKQIDVRVKIPANKVQLRSRNARNIFNSFADDGSVISEKK